MKTTLSLIALLIAFAQVPSLASAEKKILLGKKASFCAKLAGEELKRSNDSAHRELLLGLYSTKMWLCVNDTPGIPHADCDDLGQLAYNQGIDEERVNNIVVICKYKIHD